MYVTATPHRHNRRGTAGSDRAGGTPRMCLSLSVDLCTWNSLEGWRLPLATSALYINTQLRNLCACLPWEHESAGHRGRKTNLLLQPTSQEIKYSQQHQSVWKWSSFFLFQLVKTDKSFNKICAGHVFQVLSKNAHWLDYSSAQPLRDERSSVLYKCHIEV